MPGGHGLEQVVGEHRVQHGRLVDDEQIGVQRIRRVALEREAFGRLEFEQAVDGLGLVAGGLGQTFGGAARRRGQQRPMARLSAKLQTLCARWWSCRCRVLR